MLRCVECWSQFRFHPFLRDLALRFQNYSQQWRQADGLRSRFTMTSFDCYYYLQLLKWDLSKFYLKIGVFWMFLVLNEVYFTPESSTTIDFMLFLEVLFLLWVEWYLFVKMIPDLLEIFVWGFLLPFEFFFDLDEYFSPMSSFLSNVKLTEFLYVFLEILGETITFTEGRLSWAFGFVESSPIPETTLLCE